MTDQSFSLLILSMKSINLLEVESMALLHQGKIITLAYLLQLRKFRNYSITLVTPDEFYDKLRFWVNYLLITEFLKHKNIIALQGIMSIENHALFNEIYLVMEYM